MGLAELLLLAVGLSMDAFSVAISSGMTLGRPQARHLLKIGGAFGLFQGLMPLTGYVIAGLFAEYILSFDHWIAFGMLAFIGGKMLWEAVRGDPEQPRQDPTAWGNLLVLAVATSIDAMAAGVSMAFLNEGILAYRFGYLWCCGIIAAVTFVTSAAGVAIGSRVGEKLGNKAEVVGGIVLIGIGIKILIEHLLG